MGQFGARCVEPNNVVAFYNFNEGNGTTAGDGIHTYDGTIANGTWVDSFGQDGTCVEFNGNNTNVNIGDVTELSSATEFTIGFWFYQDVLDQQDWIMRTDLDGSNYIWIYTSSVGNLVALTNNAGSFGANQFDYSAVISAETWYRIIVVYDGGEAASGDRFKVYVDATEQTLAEVGTIPTSTADMSGGTTRLGYTSDALDGRLDNFTIWDKALTQAWVTKDFVKSSQGVRSNFQRGVRWVAKPRGTLVSL
jgi:hypothetical protein